MKIPIALALVLISLLTPLAEAATIVHTVFPAFDTYAYDSNSDGAVDLIRPDGVPLLAVNRTDGVYVTDWPEAVTSMEFAIPATLSSTSLISATLVIQASSSGKISGMDAPRFDVHGFAGDGVLSLADFSVDNVLFTSPEGMTVETFAVDITPFVHSVIDGHDFLGVQIALTPTGPTGGYGFVSSEGVGTPPQVIFQAVPEPSYVSLLVIGFATVAWRRHRTKT